MYFDAKRSKWHIPENTHNKINFLNTLQEYLMCKTTLQVCLWFRIILKFKQFSLFWLYFLFSADTFTGTTNIWHTVIRIRVVLNEISLKNVSKKQWIFRIQFMKIMENTLKFFPSKESTQLRWKNNLYSIIKTLFEQFVFSLLIRCHYRYLHLQG